MDQKLAISIEDLPWMLPTMFQFIWLRGFSVKAILEIE
jgi:hypothetical protein